MFGVAVGLLRVQELGSRVYAGLLAVTQTQKRV